MVESEPLEVRKLITKLQLVPHPEGGYFREIYRSGAEPMHSHGITDKGGKTMMPPGRRQSLRNISTSIYYLLTKNNSIDFLHRDQSDIVRYYHGGGTILAKFVTPDGRIEKHRLGMNLDRGDVPQLITPGGCWEALELVQGDWALVGESVTPGFDYRDMTMATEEDIAGFPEDTKNALRKYIRVKNVSA